MMNTRLSVVPTEAVDTIELDETVLSVAVVLAEAEEDEGEGALGSIRETVHDFSSCTRSSPFGPLTGVKVKLQACIMGPEGLET